MVWCSHLFQNFPQFIVMHTVKAFEIVNKAEIDVFLELSCFFNDPADVGNLKDVGNLHLSAEFQRIPRRNKKAFIRDHCKEIEENNKMEKTRDLFQKISNTNGTFQV